MPDRSGRFVAAFLLIFLGLFFSVLMYYPSWLRAEQWWPAFVLAPGLAMLATGLVGAAGSNRGLAPLAIPGCIVSTVGAILLFANVTGHWEVWAYAWALIPAAVGLGIMVSSRAGVGDESAAATGRGLLFWGCMGFLALGAFFEGLIFGGFVSKWWPVALILLGAALLVSNRRR